jgi:cytochrome c
MVTRTLLLFTALLTTTAPTEGPSTAAQVAFGHRLAQRYCGECHAVEVGVKSPFDLAPQFPELYRHYPIERLARELPSEMIAGHPHMPNMDLGPDEVSAITAYLASFRPDNGPGPAAKAPTRESP